MIAASLVLIWWQLFPQIREQIFIPLHYNIHFGVDSLGPWWRIFTIPFLEILILVVNTIAAVYLWKRERVLSELVVGTGLMCEATLFVALLFVILLNLTYYG